MTMKENKVNKKAIRVLEDKWLIRVIVTEPGCEPATDYVHCTLKELKRELIPSSDRIINTLKKARGISDQADFEIKGISAMLESESGKWPEVI